MFVWRVGACSLVYCFYAYWLVFALIDCLLVYRYLLCVECAATLCFWWFASWVFVVVFLLIVGFGWC